MVDDEGPLAFARAMGAESVREEDHLVLDLPMDADHLRQLEARAANDYEILRWQGRCPDDLIDAYAAMRTHEPGRPHRRARPRSRRDVTQRIRSGDERLAKSYDVLVAAARRADGVLGGYSLVYLPHGSDHVLQDDTLVMPEHRGHRLGLALKLATYAAIATQHPERTRFHSSTDPENRAMQATNTTFGYRPVERMHEVQVKD